MIYKNNLRRRIAATAAAVVLSFSAAAPALAAPADRKLIFGNAVTDNLDSPVDADFYSFETPDDGVISIQLDCKGSEHIKAALLDGKQTVYTHHSSSGTAYIGLESGEYTLRVFPEQFAGDDYTINVDFTPSTEWETEFNDGVANADTITLGERIFGSIMDSADRDVFTLSLSEKAYISAEFSADSVVPSGWQLTVTDGQSKVLFSGLRNGSGSTDKLLLEPGKYSVEVAPAAFSSAVYNLNLSSLSDAQIIRLGGSTRIQTSVAISKEGWIAGSSSSVVIANAYNFPDALAGETLAAALDAPILLTSGKNAIEPEIAKEIKRLGVKKVYVLGGTGVVSEYVANDLEAIAGSVERISGSDRYGTAIAIAKKIVNIKGGISRIYFASAKDFPDALSISPVAALTDGVILYMPATGSIPKAVADFAKSTGCSTVYVIGGKSAISAQGEKSIRSLGFTVERVGGADRYATSTLICTKFARAFTGGDIAVASGTSFPDALAGGVFASRRSIPVVLTGKALPASVKNYAASVDPSTVYVFGGTGAISESVAQQISQA